MIRGTTPTIKLIIDEDVKIEEIKQLYLTFKQKTVEFTKTKDDVSIEGHVITAKLSQKETLQFIKGTVHVQMRFINGENDAFATTKASFEVSDILLDGEIT